jgi:hypothetical protein
LIVNIDENPRATVDELARFVPHVIVTHPLGPADNPPLYRLLGRIFGRADQAESLCRQFEHSYQEAASATWSTQRVLYLIWKSPWMTVSRDTYISRMLATVGWDTGEMRSEARYPAIQLTPALLRETHVVLLSSEPYAFRERHCVEVLDQMPSGAHARVRLIDGSMTSWYGSRAIRGLQYLRDFRRSLS